MGQCYGIIAFPDSDALLVNLDRRAVTTIRAKSNFDIQAGKLDPKDESQSQTDGRYDRAIMVITDWLSVYFHAEERGEADLAKYLMRKFLDELIDRFGEDDEGFMRVNAKAGIIQADGNPRRF
jgi:hypothetical protein